MEEQKYNPWYYTIGKSLIKKKKPCLPHDLVHIKDLDGCFKVIDVKLTHFMVMKHRKFIEITWDRFICLKGEGTSVESEMKRELRYMSFKIHQMSAQNEITLNEIKTFMKSLKKNKK